MTGATPSPDVHAVLALALAWCVDAGFGEPRNAWHPVAWLGRWLAAIGQRLLRLPAAWAFVAGALVWCALALLLGAAAWAWQHWALAQPVWLAVPLIALLLKPCFAWRMLRDEVAAVEAALGVGVEPARARLAGLVSRGVAGMDADLVRESAVETLAENLNDSVVAPLFWFALLGLPGAVVYRFANTADALWGYRGRWEWAGKFAARADDALSWLPARLTGLALAPPQTWGRLACQARATPSPNGGWPMAAMALRLGVRLRKPGVYVLNPQAGSPAAPHMQQALRAASGVALLAFLVAAASCGFGGAGGVA